MNIKPIVREQDAAFGIIPLQKKDGVWQVLIVQSIAGNWGFPKGHSNGEHETIKDTAQRELREETGLHVVDYYPLDPFSFIYDCRSHNKYVHKTVTLFVASVQGNIHLCPIEIAHVMWIDLEKVQEKVVFEPMQSLLVRLKALIAGL